VALKGNLNGSERVKIWPPTSNALVPALRTALFLPFLGVSDSQKYAKQKRGKGTRQTQRCPALWIWLELLAVLVAVIASYLQSGSHK